MASLSANPHNKLQLSTLIMLRLRTVVAFSTALAFPQSGAENQWVLGSTAVAAE
jgi:hypothetical protein